MQRLEVSGAVRPIYGSLGFKRLYSLWYHHTCRWPSGALVQRRVLSQPVHRTATCNVCVMIPDAVQYNFDLMMST